MRLTENQFNAESLEAFRRVAFADGCDDACDAISDGSKIIVFELPLHLLKAETFRALDIGGKSRRANQSFRRHAACEQAIAAKCLSFN